MVKKEYSDTRLLAKAKGIKGWHIKAEDLLVREIAALDSPSEETPPDAKKRPELTIEKQEPEKAPVVRKRKPLVTFYWTNGRNFEFILDVIPATAVKAEVSKWFGSQNSVLTLDPNDRGDAVAIEHLRSKRAFGVEFDEVASRKSHETKAGDQITKWMELPIKSLAQLVGGKVDDFRKTKGDLIAELLLK